MVGNLLAPVALRRAGDHRLAAGGAAAVVMVAVAGLVMAPGASAAWTLVAGLGTGASLVTSRSEPGATGWSADPLGPCCAEKRAP